MGKTLLGEQGQIPSCPGEAEKEEQSLHRILLPSCPGMPHSFLALQNLEFFLQRQGWQLLRGLTLGFTPGLSSGASPSSQLLLWHWKYLPPHRTHTATSCATPSREPRQNQKVWFSPQVDFIQEWCFLLKTADSESLYISRGCNIWKALSTSNKETLAPAHSRCSHQGPLTGARSICFVIYP